MIKRNKFGAKKVEYNGILFDSTYERDRYIYLMSLQKKGEISNLRLQQKFVLIKKIVKLVPRKLKTKIRLDKRVVEQGADYHCDFLYVEKGQVIVEEFKSVMTSKLADYILRRKLMVAKIYEHNKREKRRPWVFREVVYYNKRKTVITDR